MDSLILVTDATSFSSAHIIKALQEDGCQVRGTVVSLQAEEARIKQLQELVEEPKFKVEVVEADPAKAECWESALKEVQYVVASIRPQAAQAPASEGEAPVQPAVDEVQNLFKAIVASKSVKRIVLTSSHQAITGPTSGGDKVFTEADWVDAETATDPLVKSLVLAEKAAWDFVKELPDEDKIELVVMNPTSPLGPPLLDAQQDVVKMLLDRGISGCPRVSYSIVDMRDAAAAYVKALTVDNVSGNRHILHSGNIWIKDIALALSKEYKPQGYNIHTMSLPDWALKGLGFISKNAKSFVPLVGKQSQFDNTRMKDVLGVTPRDMKETVVDEAKVLIERGLVKKPKRVRSQGSAAATATGGDTAATAEGEEAKEGTTVADEAPKENGVPEEESGKKEEGQGDAGEEKKAEEEKKTEEEKPAEQQEETKQEAPPAQA